jgi:hypothetical protein
MDTGSQHVLLALNALANAVDELQSFGYGLYLKSKARSWTQPRGVSFSGKGFQTIQSHESRQFERALTLGCAIQRDGTGDRSIVFSVLVAWNASHWSIQASVEDEDLTRDTITEALWESSEFKATTLDELVESIQNSVRALISSPRNERVAASLATIEQRP